MPLRPNQSLPTASAREKLDARHASRLRCAAGSEPPATSTATARPASRAHLPWVSVGLAESDTARSSGRVYGFRAAAPRLTISQPGPAAANDGRGPQVVASARGKAGHRSIRGLLRRGPLLVSILRLEESDPSEWRAEGSQSRMEGVAVQPSESASVRSRSGGTRATAGRPTGRPGMRV